MCRLTSLVDSDVSIDSFIGLSLTVFTFNIFSLLNLLISSPILFTDILLFLFYFSSFSIGVKKSLFELLSLFTIFFELCLFS